MDVTGVAWRKSSYSGSNGGACVEVGTFGPSVAVRDSNHPDGPQLAFLASTWQAFTDQVKRAADPVTPIFLYQTSLLRAPGHSLMDPFQAPRRGDREVPGRRRPGDAP
jgi:hypothetical protein